MNDLINCKKNNLNYSASKSNPSEGDSEDEIQSGIIALSLLANKPDPKTVNKQFYIVIKMTLAPYIQTYLAYSSSGGGCGCLPVPFERAAPHSWIRPCFDSEILEKQFKINSFKQFTIRFRYALVYMMTVSAAWLIFLLCQPYPETIMFEYIIFAQMFLVAIWILFLTFKNIYRVHNSVVAPATALYMVFISLIFTLAGGTEMVSHFTMACCVILVIYTIVPLQPYISLIICVCFSIAFETIILTTQKHFVIYYYGFIIRMLCHICIHIIGFHILVMTHVRVRGTFMKVGQRLLVRKQLEMEKQLKEKMIHSVMPPKVAGWLLSGENGENNSFARPSNHQDFGSLFRPFNMYRMDNVSILFADIVGFTKMSSNKTAEQIVDILNDLFERFDDLCVTNGCEKISTLGDCYYCVSGCPEPRQDHATCCVEMGLDMIDAIQEFDVERGEDVNMRVGVHTGTVLCGVVGTRRFKFDVWSNDVTFANKLESTGLPGRVHISEQTAQFLNEAYTLEDYEDLQGVKTYLIKTRAPVIKIENKINNIDSSKESTYTPKASLNTSRKSIHCSNSNKRTHYLSLLTEARSKFASLPNVLGSNQTLTGSAEKINYSKWFSFSKLKKNSMTEVSSSLKNLGKSNLDNCSYSGKSISRLEVTKRQDGKNEEEVSLCPSVNSKKDSGIRSSSRRSSIQQQIYLMNGMNQGEILTQRVSGYYTSSQSTLSPIESETENEAVKKPATDNLGSCFYSLRKQSDLQLIRCVNDISQNSYIVKVPLDQFTLFFKDQKTEKEYRANAHKIHEKKGDSPATLSTSRFNTYFDILVSAFVLVLTTISLYILYVPVPYFIAVSTTALLTESVALLLCLIHLTKTRNNKFNETTKFFSKKVLNLFSKWYPWHIFGGILVSLPMLVILADFTCHYASGSDHIPLSNVSFEFLATEENKKLILNVELQDEYYTILVLVGLLHFCNFTQLNFFMKSILALLTGIIYLILINKENCQYYNKNNISTIFVTQFLSKNIFINKTEVASSEVFLCCQKFKSIIDTLSKEDFDAQNYYNLGVQFLEEYHSNAGQFIHKYYATEDGVQFLSALNESLVKTPVNVWLRSILSNISDEVLNYNSSETILNVFIIMFLVILLNREFEISYRLSYYCNTESSKDKMRVQAMKNQADWLLENIIPKYVSVELKNRAKYCKNHSDVGIIFASIVNFNKLYDETYSGGKEYLRVLNELISDFDELLNLEKFKNVDKIKTIGSTFMGASGLNPELRKQNKTEYDHIFELMNFALEMYRVVDFFNRDLLGFNLILRVGFNIGEVTAGVIGSSKLFYDIWGDAVNVASRMDSCGVDGRIQVPYSSLNILAAKYEFEPRGSVYVKGKGDILVYLVKQ